MKSNVEFGEGSDLNGVRIHNPFDRYTLNSVNGGGYSHILIDGNELPDEEDEPDLYNSFNPQIPHPGDLVFKDLRSDEDVVIMTDETEKVLDRKDPHYMNRKIVKVVGMKPIFGPKSRLEDRNTEFPLSSYSFVPGRGGDSLVHVFTYDGQIPSKEDEHELFDDANIGDLNGDGFLLSYEGLDEEVMMLDEDNEESLRENHPDVIKNRIVKLESTE
ncbi:MAG: hypothetical protein ABEK17_01135 [Candidatus Aenigmatarchaeota archaeon]